MEEIKTSEFETRIAEMDKGKICFIPSDYSADRLKIHQYLERAFPDIGRMSISSDYFNAERLLTFIKCECDTRAVITYHEGFMENNKDEWYSGICPGCDESVHWEPNYDDHDDIIKIWKNNMIVISRDYGTSRPNHAITGEVSSDEFKKIMDKHNIYMMNLPKLYNKRELGKYITTEYKKWLDRSICSSLSRISL